MKWDFILAFEPTVKSDKLVSKHTHRRQCRRGKGTAGDGRTLLAIKMKASAAGGRWGKNEKQSEEKRPCVYPLLCDPGWPV